MSTGRFIPGSHAMAGFYPRGMVIIAGNSHKQLAEDVARSVDQHSSYKTACANRVEGTISELGGRGGRRLTCVQ